MRRSTVVLGVALASVGATAGAALATHSGGTGPKHDFATGTGIRTAVVSGSDTRVMMHINARGSADDARGTFFVKRTTDPPVPNRPDLDFSGRVTCLRVVGNRAIVAGVVTDDRLDLPSNPIEGTGFVGAYVDNDQLPGDADDESNSVPGGPLPGDTCPTSVAFPTAPFQQGNYVVHDYTP